MQGSKTEFFGTPVEAILQQAVAENGRQHRRLSPIRRRTVQPQHVPEPNLPFGEYNPRLSLQQTRCGTALLAGISSIGQPTAVQLTSVPFGHGT